MERIDGMLNSQKLIYVVEEDKEISELIPLILEETGHAIMLFATFADFHTRMTIVLPDLIILDVTLPDGYGTEVCRALKKDNLYKHIPVIIMSIYTEDTLLMKKSLADMFIEKPFDINDLTDAVQRFLTIGKG